MYKLQDHPAKWQLETYGRVTDATYLHTPKEFKKIVGKDYKDVEFDYEYSLLVEPWESDYQEKVSLRLNQALLAIESPFEEVKQEPRLGVFTKPRYGDLRLCSLFPFNVKGESVSSNEMYERRTVRCLFSLFNFDDGLIVARPNVIEVMPDGFFPGEGILF